MTMRNVNFASDSNLFKIHKKNEHFIYLITIVDQNVITIPQNESTVSCTDFDGSLLSNSSVRPYCFL